VEGAAANVAPAQNTSSAPFARSEVLILGS